MNRILSEGRSDHPLLEKVELGRKGARAENGREILRFGHRAIALGQLWYFYEGATYYAMQRIEGSGLDRVLHEKARLGILTALVPRPVDSTDMPSVAAKSPRPR